MYTHSRGNNQMIEKKLSRGVVISLLLWFAIIATSRGGELLFFSVDRDYDHQGELGRAYRRELEPRMFKHATWSERLYYSSADPDIGESLEVYVRSDGSRWLVHRRAVPSIDRIIGRRFWLHERFNYEKDLNAVQITSSEIPLPLMLANQIGNLWATMLPGRSKAPMPSRLVADPASYIAFHRRGERVITGAIAIAAYDSPAYRDFVAIVGSLAKACDRHAPVSDPAFSNLEVKIRRMIDQLR